MPEETNLGLMKRRDAIKKDETTTILSTLGFGDSNFNSSSAITNCVNAPGSNSSPPVSSEESEKHKHALKIIVANGTVKDFLGKRLTYEDLDSLSPKQLKKTYELYTEKKNSMITSSLSDAFIDGFTLLVTKVVNIDDVESYRNDLKNDFLTSNGINHVVGMIAVFVGRPLGFFSTSIITAKHMRLASPSKGKDCQVHEQEETQGVHQQE